MQDEASRKIERDRKMWHEQCSTVVGKRELIARLWGFGGDYLAFTMHDQIEQIVNALASAKYGRQQAALCEALARIT
jgi:hypothetical protein